MIAKLQYISQQTEALTHVAAIHKALDAGCDWVQLRVKNSPETVVARHAEEAKKLCSAYRAKLIINDYPHIAKAVEADGLHLGLQDMPIREARSIVGEKMIIGGTANTLEHIKLRVAEGAGYVGLGPFRFTTTKEKLSPVLGLKGYVNILSKLAEEGVTIPIIAIGGLVADDVAALLHAGVHGIAMSGAITHAADPADVIRSVQQFIASSTLAV
ncbi:thiamine phosphate synthase [Pontibacter korlensis]|uniref:Thiamine-phosphate synthase n=1 Tax=Pontibacter korlensis TaxID=400092 RepID=A0A0E3ZHW6_9BACT|nr:thiamine phosphate synthase [Pontibacter korlensis]AKD04255.1 thiamine-phosphate synthase [Pontibacter korlensis]